MSHLRLLRAIARLVVLAGVGFAPAARAAEELVLWRSSGRGSPETIDFFVRGARPGEQVFYAVVVDETEESARLAEVRGVPIVADPAGCAFFQIRRSDLEAADRPFFVRAWVWRDDRRGEPRVRSNPALLGDVPELYLLVESVASRGRVVLFDPRDGTIDEPRRIGFDADAVLAAVGGTAISERDRTLLPIDGGAAAEFGGREEPIDLVATPDQSAVVALTRELLPAGRALLRLRVLDAAHLQNELGAIDVLRASSSLAAAWIVMGEDSRRVIVCERDGVVREVTLGSEPAQGVTFLPRSPGGSEELLDVRLTGDRLVAVTRPALGAARRALDSRVVVVDLHGRGDPVATTISGHALDFELAPFQGGLAAFVVVKGGRVEIVPLDRGGAPATLVVPGATEITRSPFPTRLYVLASEPALEQSTVWEFDVDSLAPVPLQLPPLTQFCRWLGVVGGPTQSWLYLVESRFRPLPTSAEDEDRLWYCELDPESGMASKLAAPRLLGGRVRKVRGALSQGR